MIVPTACNLDSNLWKGRRVLLTGHTGFKGSWLAAWLVRMGAQVVGYSQAPEGPTYRLFRDSGLEGRMESHYGDLLDLPQLLALAREFQPEVMLHLAAQALVRKSYDDPVGTYASNVMGTVHALDVMRQVESLQAAVIVTTDKCYENQEWLWPYRENDVLGGHDPYSNSKACAELVTQAYRSSYLQAGGKLVATARAGNVIGGGDMAEDRLVPDAVRAFCAGQALEIRSPGATRPWQHVLDPLHGYLLLAQRLLRGESAYAEAFNFGPAEEHSVGEVVQRLVSGWGDGARFEAPEGEHPHEASRLHLDSRKARAGLGWAPRLDLEASLGMCVEFYKAWEGGGDAWRLLEGDLARFEALS